MTYQELQNYKCDKCDGSGWLHVPCLEKGYENIQLARPCKCLGIKTNVFNIKKSGLESIIDLYKFSTFTAVDQWQKTLLQKAMDYTELLINDSDLWFMVCGQIGCGKTHIATSIMRELLFIGHDAKYSLWREIAMELKRGQNDDERYSIVFDSLMKPRILYIDDFFKGNVTDADKNVAYDIINGRYTRNKPLIISSEKNCEEIMEIEQAVGSRIYQKTLGYYIEISPDAKKNIRIVGSLVNRSTGRSDRQK